MIHKNVNDTNIKYKILSKKINKLINTYDKNKYLLKDEFTKNYELLTLKKNNIN